MSVVSRWLLFLVALWIQSAGIVLVVKSFLGTSPISSLPYVMSETFPFTFGETTFAVNMVFLLGQMLILKKKFPKVQLLQAPMTMIFAAFLVTLAICLSYVEIGSIEGVREGTLISVFITGIIARFFLRHLSGWEEGRRVLRIG